MDNLKELFELINVDLENLIPKGITKCTTSGNMLCITQDIPEDLPILQNNCIVQIRYIVKDNSVIREYGTIPVDYVLHWESGKSEFKEQNFECHDQKTILNTPITLDELVTFFKMSNKAIVAQMQFKKEIDQIKLRRRIEDALRKTASQRQMIIIAGLLGVPTE